jgi:hypothetical protein
VRLIWDGVGQVLGGNAEQHDIGLQRDRCIEPVAHVPQGGSRDAEVL